MDRTDDQQQPGARRRRRLGALVLAAGAAASTFGGLAGTAAAADSTDRPPAAAPKAGLTWQQGLKAFFSFGYTYPDAQVLARIWRTPSVTAAKVMAGRKVVAGIALPIPPHKGYVRMHDLAAYFAAGYTYRDAQVLAKIWHSPSPGAAKVLAGAKLLAGSPLPFPPHKAATPL